MDPRTLTKMMVMKRLVESLPKEKQEKNLPAIEKVADKIMNDLDNVIQLLVEGPGNSRAPVQKPIKGLAA